MKIEVEYGCRYEDDNGKVLKYEGGNTWQGWVYKDYKAFESGSGVCYIPEYGFDENDNPTDTYTRQDLINVCNGNVKMATCLFEMLDWSYPETLYNEIIENWEEE